MANAWVVVSRADGGGMGDSVYVNGDYVDAAGAIGTPFVVETGDNLFEALGPDGKVHWRATQIIDEPPPGASKDDPVPVTVNPLP